VLAGLPGGRAGADLLVGVEHGDDAAVIRLDQRRALVTTADFSTPVSDELPPGSRGAVRCPPRRTRPLGPQTGR
jgi:selenophosphate synthase